MREADYVTEISCQTRLNVTKFTCTWTIHDFSLRREENGREITSSSFSTAGPGNKKWHLKLYPNGKDGGSKGFVSLYLHDVSPSNYNGYFVECKFTVIEEGGQKTGDREGTAHIYPGGFCGFAKFIERSCLLNGAARLLPNDKLTVCCEVVGIVNTANTSSQDKSLEVQVPDCHLSQDLRHLLVSRRFADVIFCVEGKEVHAHKPILAARSPVFAAMFDHKMKENEQGRVVVTDCDFDVLHEVIEFIYTGRAPKLNQMADKILAAADKYDLGRLKAMCEHVLCSKLAVETAAEMLTLADIHNADQLKASAIRFFKAHAAAVLETSGWNIVASEKPHLVAEVLRTLAV
ncbi:hypothetical protein HPB48_016389 [Haemaphysalis longicornis]|uniref:Speckle-type POZ protein n=1 Tax=Haemaphysalis longicornis TaxID=44386 RepID=A0A9J6FMH2_HAELO|nr:hypothetical protein HPB48_016389 [Haemaphysalis longicornis]